MTNNPDESFDLMIVGVGGQGTILASNVIGEACLIERRDVRSAETHGMAQRGGSVETHIRIDGKYGPLISFGCADLIISFDLLEALRYRHFLKPNGTIVSAEGIVVPVSAFQNNLEILSSDQIKEKLSDVKLITIDAEDTALKAGNILTRNIVMLGAASGFIPLKKESLLEAVRRLVPKKTVEINEKAFILGCETGERLK
ncbi:indolepyruvate oxidoreductase subunit beta [Methanomicrobium antiquum]|uniref:Indolepyruvate oxidoreductase subunit beta n=1 Tax=Methanomicrobium antiquum TaxID=487686 RepID=A0AAF0FQX7_9EURY|nr:indolepyruvate oxidoreductase subunit beta [Methanomicrobium antiquum]MDD3978426.1 indolepyruvate oxidoreductase subunit beta [Methanomicrobium sp.]WFN36959.1 indolepyruvate oxidoreductase subunit beta [Methanomicrobium antiquum]